MVTKIIISLQKEEKRKRNTTSPQVICDLNKHCGLQITPLPVWSPFSTAFLFPGEINITLIHVLPAKL